MERFLLSMMAPQVYSAIKPETGTLALLGAGHKRVSENQMRSASRWVGCLIPAGLIMGGLLMAMVVVLIPIRYYEASTQGTVSRELFEIPFMTLAVIGFPSVLIWYATCKVAVCLAHDDATEVIKAIKREAMIDDRTWSQDVAQPSIFLATNTLRPLSTGFGTGVAIMAVYFMLLLIYNSLGLVYGITTGLHIQYRQSDENGQRVIGPDGREVPQPYTSDKMVTHVVISLIAVVSPLLLARDLAHISSMCDSLLNKINELRLEWSSTDDAVAVHRRVFPLQYTLLRLNQGQGLGFCVGGKVVDKASQDCAS